MKVIRREDAKKEDRGGYIVRELGVIDFSQEVKDAVIFETTISKEGGFKDHWHNLSAELIYFLSDGTAIVDGTEHEFKVGDLVFLEPKEKHKILPKNESLKVLAIRFPNLPKDKFT